MQPQTHLLPSLKQMMFSSGPFKAVFWTAVACVLATIALGCVLPIVDCRSNYYYSCSYYYSSYTYECYYYSQQYCCSSSYRTCGDSYCLSKPSSNYRIPCWGLLYAIWILSGLALLLSVVVFIMFCNIKSRHNQLRYFNPQLVPNHYNQQPIVYAQPVQEYYQPQAPISVHRPVLYQPSEDVIENGDYTKLVIQ